MEAGRTVEPGGLGTVGRPVIGRHLGRGRGVPPPAPGDVGDERQRSSVAGPLSRLPGPLERRRRPTTDPNDARRQLVYGWAALIFGPACLLIGVGHAVLGNVITALFWVVVGIAYLVSVPFTLRNNRRMVVMLMVVSILVVALPSMLRRPDDPSPLGGLVVVLVCVATTEGLLATAVTWVVVLVVAVVPVLARDPGLPDLPVGSNLASRVALVVVVGVYCIVGAYFADRFYREASARRERNSSLARQLRARMDTLEQEVAERTAALRRRTVELETVNTQLDDSIRREVALAGQMRRLAETDDLTGLPNRRGFLSVLERVLVVGGWLALLDLDHFKRLNDTFGHPAGDIVLRRVAQTMQAAVPPEWYLARMGGEEFVLIAPDPTGELQDGRTLLGTMNTLRTRVRGLEWEGFVGADSAPWRVSVSVGAARFDPRSAPGAVTVSDLLRRADKALFAAKNAGRDRARLSAEAPPAR
ncbi:MAG: GGDEF domain-containing protein [Actinomycetales bacterium]